MVTKIGLDLGYANIAISDVSLGVYRVPSVAIIDKNTRRIISVGNDAMMGSGAENGIMVRPFKNGLFYSAEFTQSIIKAAVKTVSMTENVRCIVGVPDNLNQKQERDQPIKPDPVHKIRGRHDRLDLDGIFTMRRYSSLLGTRSGM